MQLRFLVIVKVLYLYLYLYLILSFIFRDLNEFLWVDGVSV